MCNMISCLVDRNALVYAKDGEHSHIEIAKAHGLKEDNCLKYEFTLSTRRLFQDFDMDSAPFKAKTSHDMAASKFFDDCASTPEKLIAFVERGNFDERILTRLLTPSAEKRYKKAVVPAQKACDKAIASADRAYERTEASAIRIYDKTLAPVQKTYDEAEASARKTRDEALESLKSTGKTYFCMEVRSPVWGVYDKAVASARNIYYEAEAFARKIRSEALVSADKIYDKAGASAERKLNKAKANAWAKLFSKKVNRIEIWRRVR